jgi:hypothetical protein
MQLSTLVRNILGCLALCAAVSAVALPAASSTAAETAPPPKITAYYANYDTYFNNACNPTANNAVTDKDYASAGHAVATAIGPKVNHFSRLPAI